MTPDELVQFYPQLDFLMAETFLLMSHQKKLDTYLETETDPNTSSKIVVGAITVSEKATVNEK
jgi:hypothetical protein